MADDPEKPIDPTATPPTPPKAAGDKPAGETDLKAEVSRTDSPGAGVSAAPVAQPRAEPAAPKPANPAAAQTATTSETSSATGQVTPVAKPAAAAAAARPAAPAAPKAAHPPPAPAPPSGPTDPPPPADRPAPAFIAALQSAVPDGVTALSYYLGDWTIIVPVARLIDVLTHLRDAPDARFDYLSDLTATDWPPRKAPGRFDVLYMLYSTRHRHRVRVKAKAADGEAVPSATAVWAAANWFEREVFDMFGVNFTGHPDRRRILMPEDWQGYPQRKDYPLEGPGELLMENPIDWLKLRQAKEEADIE